jgi:hypothetical protein
MFAVEKSPTEQPTLLNAIHGSGAVSIGAVADAGTVGEYTMDGARSAVDGVFVAFAMTGEFQ